jgi:hypothetical protein
MALVTTILAGSFRGNVYFTEVSRIAEGPTRKNIGAH